jgi:hypothetical protein
MGIAQLILALLTQAPAAYAQLKSLYDFVRADLSSTDQATLDAAFATAKAQDAADTATADAALTAAASKG